MSFPFKEYDLVATEAREIIEDRDAIGRNGHLEFWEGFPHGVQDMTFEIWRRTARVLGAEKIGDTKTMRADLIDQANYCLFAIMALDRDVKKAE